MKKNVVLILSVVLTFSMLASCGSKKGSGVDTPRGGQASLLPSAEQTPSAGKKDDDKIVEGSEISIFTAGYMEDKTAAWEAVSRHYENQEDWTFGLATLGFVFVDLIMAEIMMFDALTLLSGDMFKGKLMFSDIEAWKKPSGNIIEFGYEYEYKEDGHNSEKGDKEYARGKLNQSTGALQYEKYVERGGVKISKQLIELVKNDNKSYCCQIYILSGGESGKYDLSGYITWLNGSDIECIGVEEANTTFDFSYNSIINKKNVKAEEMAAGKNIILKTSYINGQANFESSDD
jgi:predicted small secreted protein